VTTPVEPFFGAVAHCGSAVTPGAAERSYARKRYSFLSFPYVCPKPALAK
jgi:hypothetical protein